MLAQILNNTDFSQFISFKDLLVLLFASSGLLAIVFTIISKTLDNKTRVTIMAEIKTLDEKYIGLIKETERDVNKVKLNYLDRFAEQRALITANKEIAEDHHSEIKQILVEIKKDLEVLRNKQH